MHSSVHESLDLGSVPLFDFRLRALFLLDTTVLHPHRLLEDAILLRSFVQLNFEGLDLPPAFLRRGRRLSFGAGQPNLVAACSYVLPLQKMLLHFMP